MRLYSVEEANRALGRVRQLVHELRRELDAYEFARDQLEDLERMWGARIEDPTCPDRTEHVRFVREAVERSRDAETALGELREMGLEVKDPKLGLVDFYHERGGDVVFLCWQDGEERVAHWHTIAGGFPARKPLG